MWQEEEDKITNGNVTLLAEKTRPGDATQTKLDMWKYEKLKPGAKLGKHHQEQAT